MTETQQRPLLGAFGSADVDIDVLDDPPGEAPVDIDAAGEAPTGILCGGVCNASDADPLAGWTQAAAEVPRKVSTGETTRPVRSRFGFRRRRGDDQPGRAVRTPAVTAPIPHNRADGTNGTAPSTTAAALSNSQRATQTRPAANRSGRRGERVAAADLPDVLTVDELSGLLRVDRKSVYAMIARSEIPGVRRIGRTIRIAREAVLDWLRQGGVARRRKPK